MAKSNDASARTIRARIAAYSRWAQTPDASGATAPARQAFNERFAREVDPDSTLPVAVRARLAEAARKAYYTRLAYASAKARRR